MKDALLSSWGVGSGAESNQAQVAPQPKPKLKRKTTQPKLYADLHVVVTMSSASAVVLSCCWVSWSSRVGFNCILVHRFARKAILLALMHEGKCTSQRVRELLSLVLNKKPASISSTLSNLVSAELVNAEGVGNGKGLKLYDLTSQVCLQLARV